MKNVDIGEVAYESSYSVKEHKIQSTNLAT